MTVLCPCCNQPVTELAKVEALADIPLDPTARIIVRRLAMAFPRAVPVEAVMNAVYSGSREPDVPQQVVRQAMRRLRTRLEEYGWTIPVPVGGQGNAAHYRLEPVR